MRRTAPITVTPKIEEWFLAMTNVLHELRRVLKPGGHIAFEVGEVRNGKVELEKAVLLCGAAVGLEPLAVLINAQQFIKTSHCWKIANGMKETNTNRIVVFRKRG